MNLYFIFLAALILLTLIFFIQGIIRFWSNLFSETTASIKRRLRVIMGEITINYTKSIKKRRLSEVPQIDIFLQKIPGISKLDTLFNQSGIKFNVEFFLIRCFLMMLFLGFAAFWAKISWEISFCVILIPMPLWLAYIYRKLRHRIKQIEAQLPDALNLMARAMQAGHAFSSALLIVGSEGLEPIRLEFQTVFDEINYGISTEIALHHLTQRVASGDLRFFVVAVLIQLETGGNLSEILKSLVALIRDRQRIAGNVRVLSAEGRLSAWILGLLPFVLAGLLSLVNHDFIAALWTDPLGIRMLEVSFTLMIFGIWWMWRLVSVRV